MFFSKENIKNNIVNIINKDADNDMFFIVACKGVGKLQLLNEFQDMDDFSQSGIIADGRNVTGSCSCLTKCFIDGIFCFLKKHDNLVMRYKFCKTLDHYKICYRYKFSVFNKLDINSIAIVLQHLPLDILKEIYIDLAGDTRLILLANAIILRDCDREYLYTLKDDTWGAKVSFIIAIRPEETNLHFINNIILQNHNKVWVFPLLPEMSIEMDKTLPTKLSSITINGIGNTENFPDFQRNLLSCVEYIDMYDKTKALLRKGLTPHHLFFLANQDIDFFNYEYMKDMNGVLFNRSIEDEKVFILRYDGHLIWVDSLSYYLVLHYGIEEAISETQRFFFDILLGLEQLACDDIEYKDHKFFLRRAINSSNSMAYGFSTYFSNFAKIVDRLSISILYGKYSFQRSCFTIKLLDQIMLDFSETNIKAIGLIYEHTQICDCLNMGLSRIKNYFLMLNTPICLPYSTTKEIEKFQARCLMEAYRWMDLTLIDAIVDLQRILLSKNYKIRFEFSHLTDNDKLSVYYYFKNQLEKNNIKIGEVIMPDKTIFLSYCHQNSDIADVVDDSLQNLGYEVKRDVRDVKSWDSLKEFMKTIRTQDFVVLLISDQYLKSENCMYEVMQLMKDDSFKYRTFPIVIEFPKSSGMSMFGYLYWMDVVSYWQKQAEILNEKLQAISRENSAGLDLKYREIKNMAQNADAFMESFFNDPLLPVIKPENQNVDHIINDMNRRIKAISAKKNNPKI